jgi:hypothetical protein
VATTEYEFSVVSSGIFTTPSVGAIQWFGGPGTMRGVRAKLSSGTGVFNLGTDPGTGQLLGVEELPDRLWHLMADDLGAPAGASNNDTISGWYSNMRDKNAVLPKFDAPDSGEEPLYKTADGPGASEALTFDGTDDILVMSAGVVTLDYDADFTAVAVLGDFTSGNQRPIIGNSDLSTSTGQSWNSMWGHKGGDLRVRNDSNEYNDGNSDLGTDELRVLVCENSTTSRSLVTEYVDGVSKYSDQQITISSSSGGWTYNAIGGMQRNRNGTTPPSEQNRLYKGSISEVILFEGALTTDQRQLVEGALAHKYSLTGSLPVSHPHKSTDPISYDYKLGTDIVLATAYDSQPNPNFTVKNTDIIQFYVPLSQNPGTLTVELDFLAD